MKIIGYKSLWTLIVIIVLFIVGCNDMILEYEQVGKFQINELYENGKKYIEISGLCLHSSMNIDKVNHFQENDSIFITVFLTLKRNQGSSGNFKEKIEISDNVKNIYFGKNRKLIWNVSF